MSFAPAFETTEGDAAPPWVSKLGDATNDPLNLAGASVTAYLWNAITKVPHALLGTASVVDAHPSNLVQYLPDAGDFPPGSAGDYALKWRVTLPGGSIESFPADHLLVRVHAAPPTS